MKSHWIVIPLLLLAPLVVAAEEPAVEASAAEVASTDQVEPLFQPANSSTPDSTLEQPGSVEENLFLAVTLSECTHPQPSVGFCDGYDNSYCDYEWDCKCCCVAVWSAPGAHCPNVCV